MGEENTQYASGTWTWNDLTNELVFVSANQDDQQGTTQGQTATKVVVQSAFEVKFRETVDNVEKIRFRRRFQRKAKIGTTSYIILQDIKDVVLFLASPKDLTTKFIKFFHTETVDSFLRAAMVYFQYYIQVWETLIDRREEAKRKIPHLGVKGILGTLSEELSCLRCVLAREYTCMLTGAGEMLEFHHMGSMRAKSLTGKERYLFEVLLCITIRVVWIGMQRKYLNLIERELNRLIRGKLFNIIQHRDIRLGIALEKSKEEDRVLDGQYCVDERKLYHRSPFAQELILANHDYRLLGIGVKNFTPKDPLVKYLEIAFSAPETVLFEKGIQVGILGMPSKCFDAMLYYRGKISMVEEKRTFHIPPYTPVRDEEVMEEFPTESPLYEESHERKLIRQKQCDLWVNHIKMSQSGKAKDAAIPSVTVLSTGSTTTI